MGLINKKKASEKTMHINHMMKPVCASRGWLFIDNAHIKIEHMENKDIHLNGVGVKIQALNTKRQGLKATIQGRTFFGC